MKKFIYIVLAFLTLYSCQDDRVVFEVSVLSENLSFRAVAGGAVMHYKLPSDAEVLSIRIRYKDAFGQEILRTGSYACDSLNIIGFNEARQGVKAYVTLCDRNNVESEPVEVTFDTEDSGPVSFFERLEVKPGWTGFSLSYDIPKDARGMAHVFYVGKMLGTGEPDTLLLKSFLLTKGCDTLHYSFQWNQPSYDVIVRTEDFRGYRVKQKIWTDVKPYGIDRLDPSGFGFFDPSGLSVEDPAARLGKEYLFDGDKKGEGCFSLNDEIFNTYLAGPECIDKPLFIIDLKKPTVITEVWLYGMLYVRTFPKGKHSILNPFPVKYGPIWTGRYDSKLPCEVTVYASNDKENANSWKRVSHFKQDRGLENDLRWSARCNDGAPAYRLRNKEQVEEADPCFMSLTFPVSGETYRYLKVVVNDLFSTSDGLNGKYEGGNSQKYVTIHELEVFTKKD